MRAKYLKFWTQQKTSRDCRKNICLSTEIETKLLLVDIRKYSCVTVHRCLPLTTSWSQQIDSYFSSVWHANHLAI